MTYIKLTKDNGTTRNDMKWAVGITNKATGQGNILCSDGVLHVYDTPEQASFMRFAHCNSYTRAWEVQSRCKGVSDGTKRGIKSCTVVREIEIPELTTEQRIEIAIRASLLVYTEDSYVRWANDWLSNRDRSIFAADVAADAAAKSVSCASNAACAVAEAVVHVANDPVYAASNAACAAADAAAEAIGGIDLLSIIKAVVG